MKLLWLVLLLSNLHNMIVALHSKHLLFAPSSRVLSLRRWALFLSTESQRTLSPGSHVAEMEIKKSRFLGHAQHAENWNEAQAYISQVKSEHPKARHWCYAFQCGVNPVSERCSDDGEPTGTAGSPILGMVYIPKGTCCIYGMLWLDRSYSNSCLFSLY
jgi:hypothetical protein